MRSQRLAQQQGARAEAADVARGDLPDPSDNDIEDGPGIGATRDHDMDSTVGREERERQRQFVERTRCEVDRLALEAEPRSCGQEGHLVEPRRRHGRQATDIGFADGPPHLLSDVEQGPHQGIDAGAAAIVPHGLLLEASVLEGSHAQGYQKCP